ncbi:hypothetical protein [Pseudomonas alloputida]|uniref:hypothetical protein n=1 Tax=Pseudomonas alloputida TaxID=1940621 RepID=UPI00320A4F78
MFTFDTNSLNNLSLISKGVRFHNLSHDALLASLAGSLNSSLYPNQILIGSPDYYYAWAWSAQLLLNSNTAYLGYEDYDLTDLLKNAVISALCSSRSHDSLQLSHYEKLLLSRSIHIFPYLTFPLLESVLRKANSNYISRDGKITCDFKVPSRGGGTTKYGKGGKRTCSSVRDLLWLYYNNASTAQKKSIDECLVCISNQGKKHPFDQIYDWRNGLMHGNESLNLAGGAILTLSLTILLIETESEFEQMREKACEFVRIYQSRPGRPEWIYYPPF